MDNDNNNTSRPPLTDKERRELEEQLIADTKQRSREYKEEFNRKFGQFGGSSNEGVGIVVSILSFVAVLFWMFVFTRGCHF